jgi:Fe2+ transport system protein FeoA
LKKSDLIEDLEMYIRARFNPKGNPKTEAENLLQRLLNLGLKPGKHYIVVDDDLLGKTRVEVDWEPEDE